MSPTDEVFSVPRGDLLQMPGDAAMKWVQQQFETSRALNILHDHFSKQGFTFLVERAKVFAYMGRDGADKVTASVLGVLPSFVPTTSADAAHSAVGISVHDSGYAIATGVNVSHKPFGVTDFTLYEIDPRNRSVVSSSVSLQELRESPLERTAERLGRPVTPEVATQRLQFTSMSPGDQGLLIGTVIQQLLGDKFSRSLFPPEYAQALNMQIPTFQKFAFATRARYSGTGLNITLSTSSSTSSNICTSTSTSTIGI
jgi:hypothetical protein